MLDNKTKIDLSGTWNSHYSEQVLTGEVIRHGAYKENAIMISRVTNDS